LTTTSDEAEVSPVVTITIREGEDGDPIFTVKRDPIMEGNDDWTRVDSFVFKMIEPCIDYYDEEGSKGDATVVVINPNMSVH